MFVRARDRFFRTPLEHFDDRAVGGDRGDRRAIRHEPGRAQIRNVIAHERGEFRFFAGPRLVDGDDHTTGHAFS
jgi:hypothetical protein